MSGNGNGRHNGLNINQPSPVESLGKAVSNAIDPYGVTTSLLNAQMAWLMHPQELTRAMSALSGDLVALQSHLMRRSLGNPAMTCADFCGARCDRMSAIVCGCSSMMNVSRCVASIFCKKANGNASIC